jgi:Heavy-metal resistance
MRHMIFAFAGLALAAGAVQAQTPPIDGPPPAQMAPEGPPPRPMQALLSKLSPEGRAILQAEMEGSKADRQTKGQARRAARDKIRTAMLTEPYNAGALRSAFEEERKLAAEQQKLQHENMVNVLGKLSSADRRLFADSMGQMEQKLVGFRQKLQLRDDKRRSDAAN